MAREPELGSVGDPRRDGYVDLLLHRLLPCARALEAGRRDDLAAAVADGAGPTDAEGSLRQGDLPRAAALEARLGLGTEEGQWRPSERVREARQ